MDEPEERAEPRRDGEAGHARVGRQGGHVARDGRRHALSLVEGHALEVQEQVPDELAREPQVLGEREVPLAGQERGRQIRRLGGGERALGAEPERVLGPGATEGRGHVEGSRLVRRPDHLDLVADAHAEEIGNARRQGDLVRARRQVALEGLEVRRGAVAEQERGRDGLARGTRDPGLAARLRHVRGDRDVGGGLADERVEGGVLGGGVAVERQPGVADRGGRGLDRGRGDGLARGVGIDRPGDEHADGEAEADDDREPEQSLGGEAREQEAQRPHGGRAPPEAVSPDDTLGQRARDLAAAHADIP